VEAPVTEGHKRRFLDQNVDDVGVVEPGHNLGFVQEADAASSATMSFAASKYAGLRGVATIRAAHAARSAAISSAASEFAGFRGVADVRAADAAMSAAR
jgi:hypothetical protein